LLFTLSNFLAVVGLESWDKAQIVVQSLASGERKVVMSGGSDGRYLPTGHLVYAFGSTVMAVPFDMKTHEIHGARIPVLESVTRSPVGTTAATDFVISDDGTLAYVPGTAFTDTARKRPLALVDRTGKSQTLQLPAQTYLHPRVSHDGKEVVFASDDGKDAIIYIYDLKGSGPPRRLTFGGRNLYPIWHPDGRHITFQSDREGDSGIFQQPTDGGMAERLTTADPGSQHVPESWSPDGKTLLFTVANPRQGLGIWALSLDGDRKPRPLIHSAGSIQINSAFSPDGHWIAYNAVAGGSYKIFVQPFPLTGQQYQLTTEISWNPAWSPDGKEIFYRPGLTFDRDLMALDVQTTPSFAPGKATSLPVLGLIDVSPVWRNYDITPDGKFII